MSGPFYAQFVFTWANQFVQNKNGIEEIFLRFVVAADKILKQNFHICRGYFNSTLSLSFNSNRKMVGLP